MKRIITVATTGAWSSKKDNPNVPISPKEIARDVIECYKAGASIAHIHVRDDEAKGSMDLEKFEETVKLIKKESDIIINLTTSGELGASDDKRMNHLEKLKPEMASFDCGTMNWGHNTIFENHPKFLEKLGRTMIENSIKPEIEIFDAGMVYNSLHYIKNSYIEMRPHYQFVLGVAGGMGATIKNLVFLKDLIPENSTWSAFGIGRYHVPILMGTIALGGHIRVGLEDSLMMDKNTYATNLSLTQRAVELIKIANLEVATVSETREILGLK